ncbi:hypothetical protein IJI55_02535 [Candidatus Saccharibacteria bacterium]|nr:hypothetical protein [Candidatus Saccharibacteria bacterium]MBR0403400.1 hypothetical protein [Candidatus Saccharibacteria bacterium]
MSTIFLETYNQIEEEVIQLTYDIAFDDAQLKVHSNHIANLILMISTEIESISKAIYRENGGRKRTPAFDYECIDKMPNIKNANALVICRKMDFAKPENIVLFPFRKTEYKRNKTKTPIYPWNNAYQNLKHDKAKMEKRYANIRYLMYSLAALYALLIRYGTCPNSQIFSSLDDNGMYWKPSRGRIACNIDSAEVKQYYLQNRTA